MKVATTALFINKRHPKGSNNKQFPNEKAKKAWLEEHGLCAISIRVTYDRVKRYYRTKYSLTIQDWEKTQGEKPREPFKALKLELAAEEKRAQDMISALPKFAWELFEEKYLQKRTSPNTISDSFKFRINELKNAGQIGTATCYECAQKSISGFIGNSKAKLEDIKPELLIKYEQYMLNLGNSRTTISIYLRSLRSLFNYAITKKHIAPECYPFRRNTNDTGKYEIKEGSNLKKALTIAEIKKIFGHKTEKDSYAHMAKDYWIFLYLSNGMNVKDFCLLKYKDLDHETITFIRAKTVNQKKEKKIQVVLQPETKEIIKYWGNKKKDGNTFIFPILTGKETPERQRQLIQQLTHVINSHTKQMSDHLGFSQKLTTYVARHSFATVMKRSGASKELISEMLGHSELKTTQNYLDSFESDTLKEATKALTNFKKPNRNK